VALVKLELVLHLELEEENLGWRKKSLEELLAPSLRKKMTKRWCSSPASSSGEVRGFLGWITLGAPPWFLG
jgi:hypothetical protein